MEERNKIILRAALAFATDNRSSMDEMFGCGVMVCNEHLRWSVGSKIIDAPTPYEMQLLTEQLEEIL